MVPQLGSFHFQSVVDVAMTSINTLYGPRRFNIDPFPRLMCPSIISDKLWLLENLLLILSNACKYSDSGDIDVSFELIHMSNANFDDLLLNYLMAHHLGPGVQYADYVRPSKRFDVGKLTSARLSAPGGGFGPVRHNCTRDFAALFGNPLLGRTFPIEWGAGLSKPLCGPSWLGCLFI